MKYICNTRLSKVSAIVNSLGKIDRKLLTLEKFHQQRATFRMV